MKITAILFAVLIIAIPATAADIEIIGGAGVGHELGRPAGESFNVAWFGPTVKTWNDGDTRIRTLLLYGNYEERNLSAWGGEAILSDVLWKSDGWPRQGSVLFAVGFMDQYYQGADGERDVAPKVGAGLSIQLTSVIWLDGFYTAFHSGPDWKQVGPDWEQVGPDWKQVGYIGLHSGIEFSIGGAK